jgi:hypothetical protein
VIYDRRGREEVSDQLSPKRIIGRSAKADDMIVQRLPTNDDLIPINVFD